MNFVSSREDYDLYDAQLRSLIDKSKYLPENMFREHLGYFHFFDYVEIFMPSFFSRMKEFIEAIGDPELIYAVVDPDPETFYFRHFGCYSVLVLTGNDTEETFISGVNDYPKESPGDAMNSSTRCVLVSSSGGGWAVYGDYEFEIAICAFTNESLMKRFEAIYNDKFYTDVNEAAESAYYFRTDGSDKAVFCNNLQYRIPKPC